MYLESQTKSISIENCECGTIGSTRKIGIESNESVSDVILFPTFLLTIGSHLPHASKIKLSVKFESLAMGH